MTRARGPRGPKDQADSADATWAVTAMTEEDEYCKSDPRYAAYSRRSHSGSAS
jgi:hypothetical protein